MNPNNTIIVAEMFDNVRGPRELVCDNEEKPRFWAKNDRVIVRDPRGFKYLGKVIGYHRDAPDSPDGLYIVLIYCNTICGWASKVDVQPCNILGYAKDVLPSEIDRELKALL